MLDLSAYRISTLNTTAIRKRLRKLSSQPTQEEELLPHVLVNIVYAMWTNIIGMLILDMIHYLKYQLIMHKFVG